MTASTRVPAPSNPVADRFTDAATALHGRYAGSGANLVERPTATEVLTSVHACSDVDTKVAATLSYAVTRFSIGPTLTDFGAPTFVAAAVTAVGIGVADLSFGATDTRGDTAVVNAVTATALSVSATRLAHCVARTTACALFTVAGITATVGVVVTSVTNVDTGHVAATDPIDATRRAAVDGLLACFASCDTSQRSATIILFVFTPETPAAATVRVLQTDQAVCGALCRGLQARPCEA